MRINPIRNTNFTGFLTYSTSDYCDKKIDTNDIISIEYGYRNDNVYYTVIKTSKKNHYFNNCGVPRKDYDTILNCYTAACQNPNIKVNIPQSEYLETSR